MAQPYTHLNQPSARLTDEQLLDLYLRLSRAECEEQFADTGRSRADVQGFAAHHTALDHQ